ncbi:twin-arginine translocase subunit TatC [Pedosphaera parvula]|uniref:Sec-independent protein translocase protein TatC n=1 Tax=Pedosphaera parvula (strain Ellin514) TaxID=320771 RepID=B9XKH0_PEDPL|nr:twin-arginine translocase subunit TatC [Pedosphaera parvula]EEF59640.1 Sec-independent protein translocase, TatC subunit [Pedosphaera parvula Ellin514]
MANEPEEGRLPEDEEGGPVKSFLEHLEDLRWMLIKSSAVLAVAVIVCLIAGNYVVKVLMWPLERAVVKREGNNQVVSLFFGTNRLGSFELDKAQEKDLNLGTNRYYVYQLAPVPITVGTNQIQVLAFSPDTTRDAAREARRVTAQLSILSPAGAFMTAFHVAMYAGIAVSSPFIFYFLAQFIFPALKMNEKRYIYRGLGFGFGLFITGVLFCYFVLMPVALAAAQMYANWMGFSAAIWQADEYIGFVCKFMLGMGLGFEMPVVILVLVKLGLLNYAILKKARPYMIVINLILGAVLTTPEVVTQVLMAVPLQILFEISLLITWYWERKERKKEEAAAGIIDAK